MISQPVRGDALLFFATRRESAGLYGPSDGTLVAGIAFLALAFLALSLLSAQTAGSRLIERIFQSQKSSALNQRGLAKPVRAHPAHVRTIPFDFDIGQERSCKVRSLDTNLNWVGVRE